MTVAEFKLLYGEQWGSGFDAKLGWAAKKLCLQLHGKIPPKKRYRIAGRNKVPAYPCGVLEQAYRQLRSAQSGGQQIAERLWNRVTAPQFAAAGGLKLKFADWM